MTTSEAGLSTEGGFTLVELMVVLVIVGLLFGSAVVFVPGVREDRLTRELERFQLLAGIARDRAMLEASPYGVGIWRGGYAFYRLSGSWEWQGVADDARLRPREWPQGYWLDLYLDGLKAALPGEEKPENPQIHFLADGISRPFALHLFKDARAGKRLIYDNAGKAEIALDAD